MSIWTRMFGNAEHEAGKATKAAEAYAPDMLHGPMQDGSQVRKFGGMFAGNLKEDAGGGWGAVAKRAAFSGAKAGVVGGLVGGSMSAMQGGDFWSGAKEGAFNTGMAYGAYRTAGRGLGAMTRNPLSGGGPMKAGANMWKSVSRNSKISEPARKLLNHKQQVTFNRQFMGQ